MPGTCTRSTPRERFYAGLAGIEDPEQKRRVIGDLFIRVQQEEIARLGIERLLARPGHAVHGPRREREGRRRQGERHQDAPQRAFPAGGSPARAAGASSSRSPSLYKDEVRALGLALGLRREIVFRHPFPGPGLAVRILGEVTREKCALLRRVDALFLSELRSRGLYEKIWQAFCVLLPAPLGGRLGRRATLRLGGGAACGRFSGRHHRRRVPVCRRGTCSKSPR